MNGVAIPNHGFAVLDNIGEGDESLFCLTDLPACCRRPYTTDPMMSVLGNWFFPNGTRVVSSGNQWDFHRTRGQMVVRLHRRRGGATGIYHCNVPDQNGEQLSRYVGVYTTNTGGYSQETSFKVSARSKIRGKNIGTKSSITNLTITITMSDAISVILCVFYKFQFSSVVRNVEGFFLEHIETKFFEYSSHICSLPEASKKWKFLYYLNLFVFSVHHGHLQTCSLFLMTVTIKVIASYHRQPFD